MEMDGVVGVGLAVGETPDLHSRRTEADPIAGGGKRMDSSSSPRRPHVAILAFPFGTHTPATYALTRKLAAASPAATFSLFSTARANALLPRFAHSGRYPNLRLHAVPDGRPEGFVPDPRNPVREIELFFEAAPGAFHEGLEAAVREAGGAGISCVVSDSFLCSFAGQLAGEMGVPFIQFWPSAPRCLLVHLYTGVLRRTLGTGFNTIEEKGEEKLEFVPGLSVLRVRDLPDGVVFGDLDSLFARALHRVEEEAPRAAAVVLATCEGLEPAADAGLKAVLNKCFSVGPLELAEANARADEPDESRCLPWLDLQPPRSVVYVCFGSGIMSPPPAELAELAEGLECSGAPFLWSLRESARALLPSGFLERTRGRGIVVPWAPQPLVLAHAAVGAFVTHCGWNSVMESITRGVPMICRPLLGDQRVIARAVAHEWEAGVRMPGDAFTKEGVVGAVNAVMKTDAGQRMRDRARRLGELAVTALAPGGSSSDNFDRLADMICRC